MRAIHFYITSFEITNMLLFFHITFIKITQVVCSSML